MNKPEKPAKPRPDFPLFPHATGQWAKKIQGRTQYFGPWSDPQGAEARYLARLESPRITQQAVAAKPVKPYPDFPLTPHPRGQWCKRIRGRLHYFGPVDDWQAALDRYRTVKDDLHAGRAPQPKEGLTVSQLVSLFIHDRKQAVQRGRIRQRTLEDYEAVVKRMLGSLRPERLVSDLRPLDFANLVAKLSATRGTVSLHGDITRMRTLFSFGDENYHVKPNYGTCFQKPTKLELRRARRLRGEKKYTAPEIRRLLRAASGPLRAMILLGINCGFGNEDCATLTLDKLDLERGWHHHERPKTEQPRRCPLWPETVTALRAVLATRPKPQAGGEKLVFLTHHGRSWSKTRDDNPLSKAMRKLLNSVGIKRPGVNFYALRHTFQTVAEDCHAVATQYIMGHVAKSDDMAAVYREGMTNAKLRQTVQYVRRWLFKSARPVGSSRSNPGNQTSPSASESDVSPAQTTDGI